MSSHPASAFKLRAYVGVDRWRACKLFFISTGVNVYCRSEVLAGEIEQLNHAFGGVRRDGSRRTPCPRWSGRIEARTGLRMMPTFPRSSLSFRTAGFPQYGWKAGLSGGAFPSATQLKSAPDMRCLSSGLHPPFVHLVVTTFVPHCVGPWTR